MPRPRKFRRVCCMPVTECFGPVCPDGSPQKDFSANSPDSCHVVQMSVDEYETIRLMDLEDCTQEECAGQMGIARTTVQGIYNDARKKLADALVHGKLLTITGGDYILCENFETNGCPGCKKRCRHHCHSTIIP
ncbi:MAG: DUF134 domain-containing protein [Clostridiales bacterium]|uniref:DUF134 domain-containing protein n=1 Tax=Aminipila sp. TaxID=2060095 RepID=UPI001DAEEB31|nr:DUF134 domain-containing protein [Aminipila sp.]MBE6033086.1 DUF134 domain-containing protein [Clostridiales bacterium]